MRVASLFTCFATITSTGCVVLAPTDAYQTVSPRPALHTRSIVASQPVQNPDEPLDLEQAIRIALEHNPEVAATRWGIDAASARRDLAIAAALPQFHGVAGYSHTILPQRLTPVVSPAIPGVGTRDIFAGDLVLTMPLFTGGSILSRIKAAELLTLASEHELARTREELVYNVSSVFFNILAQERVIDSLAFSVETLERHAQRIRDMIAVAKAAKVDLLRTEVRLAELRQQWLQEKGVLDIQHRVLTNLMGVSDQRKEVRVQGRLSVEPDAETMDTEKSVAMAWGQRDDYLAARASLEAQARNVDAARGGRWPTVAFQGSYGGRWAVNPTTRPADASTSAEVGQIGVVMDIPIFDGGRIDAQIREERSKLNAAMERLRKLQLQVRLEVETAVVNVETSRQRVEVTEKAIEQAEESLRIEREKYELGKGAIVDVLDAQSALLEAQTSHYRALADFNVALAQLKLATGAQE
ncbi:MAG: TolC family protein [Phycisphaerae bacterium]